MEGGFSRLGGGLALFFSLTRSNLVFLFIATWASLRCQKHPGSLFPQPLFLTLASLATTSVAIFRPFFSFCLSSLQSFFSYRIFGLFGRLVTASNKKTNSGAMSSSNMLALTHHSTPQPPQDLTMAVLGCGKWTSPQHGIGYDDARWESYLV